MTDDKKKIKEKVETKDPNQKAYFKKVFDTERPERRWVKAALKYAHEMRQFETRLYWQRNLYFWGFVAALFTAYFVLLRIVPLNCVEAICLPLGDKNLGYIVAGFLLIVSVVGYFVSFGWLFIEKGAKSWQENWEMHIDYLEDSITGKLHKTIMGTPFGFFSLSKIHTTFIFTIAFVWSVLIAFALTINLGVFDSKGLSGFLLSKNNFNMTFTVILVSVLFLGMLLAAKKGRFFKGFWRTSKRTLPAVDPLSKEQELIQRKLCKLTRPESADRIFLTSENKKK